MPPSAHWGRLLWHHIKRRSSLARRLIETESRRALDRIGHGQLWLVVAATWLGIFSEHAHNLSGQRLTLVRCWTATAQTSYIDPVSLDKASEGRGSVRSLLLNRCVRSLAFQAHQRADLLDLPYLAVPLERYCKRRRILFIRVRPCRILEITVLPLLQLVDLLCEGRGRYLKRFRRIRVLILLLVSSGGGPRLVAALPLRTLFLF